MRFRVARFEDQCPPEIISSSDWLVLVECENAEIVEGPFVFGGDPERSLGKGTCGRGISPRDPQITEGEIGLCVVRDEAMGTLQMVFGQGEVVRFEREPARVIGLERPQ